MRVQRELNIFVFFVLLRVLILTACYHCRREYICLLGIALRTRSQPTTIYKPIPTRSLEKTWILSRLTKNSSNNYAKDSRVEGTKPKKQTRTSVVTKEVRR